MELPEFYDIYEISYVPFWHTRWFLIVCIVLFCTIICSIATCAIMWSLLRWKKRNIPCDVVALKMLADSAIQNELNTGLSNAFYTTLIKILKTYSEKRYHLCLESCTDNELFVRLATTQIPAEQLALFKNILMQATNAKFADASIMQDQMVIDHECATIIVKQTTHAAMETARNINTKKRQQGI